VSSAKPTLVALRPWGTSTILVGLLLAIVPIALMVGGLANKPLWGLAACLALPLAIPVIYRPNLVTVGVLFVVYTNAAAVAVRFHGVPFFLAACAPLALAIPLVHFVIIRGEKVILDGTWRWMVGLLAVHLAAAIFSSDPRRSLEFALTFLVEGVGLYWLVVNVVRSREMLRRSVWVLLAAGAFMGALSCFQQATGTYGQAYGGFAQVEENAGFATGESDLQGAVRQRRLAGPLGTQNRYAQIMLMLVPLGLFAAARPQPFGWRIAALGATAVIALGLALTFSRGAVLGFGLVVVVMIGFRYISMKQAAIVALGMGLVVLALPQYAARMKSLAPLLSAVRDESSVGSADGSIRSRAGEALAAMLMAVEQPLTGVGPGMYSQHYQHYAARVGTELAEGIKVKEELREPHVLYLGLAAELGIPGVSVFLLIVTLTLRRLAGARRRCRKRDPELANLLTGFLLAIVAYLGTAFFLHFAYIRFFWLMMALAGAAACVAARIERECKRADLQPLPLAPTAGGRPAY